MKSAMFTASYNVDIDKANKVIQLELIELQCGSVLGKGRDKKKCWGTKFLYLLTCTSAFKNNLICLLNWCSVL